MGTRFSVGRHGLDLAVTMGEALNHMQQRQAEGYPLTQVAGLFADVIEAFAEIEEAVTNTFADEAEDPQYVAAAKSLRDGMRVLTDAYEDGIGADPFDIVAQTLLPRYAAWHDVLQRLLLPHVVS